MRRIIAAFAIILVSIAAAAGYIWSGYYNIAATVPHWDITFELLEVVRDRSISHHSKGIVAPQLNDPKLSRTGFEHFHSVCRMCHGAPGYDRNAFALGLYPSPPDLRSEEIQSGLKDAELFWIIQNGLKMTGMPAIDDSDHGEKELWGIVAFLRSLPKLQPDQYKAMVVEAGLPEGEEGAHHHDHEQ